MTENEGFIAKVEDEVMKVFRNMEGWLYKAPEAKDKNDVQLNSPHPALVAILTETPMEQSQADALCTLHQQFPDEKVRDEEPAITSVTTEVVTNDPVAPAPPEVIPSDPANSAINNPAPIAPPPIAPPPLSPVIPPVADPTVPAAVDKTSDPTG